MNFTRTYLRLLGSAPRGQVLGLLALMLLAGLSEGAGMMLLVPLLQLLQGGGAAMGLAKALLDGLAALGLPPTVPGLLIAFVLLVALRGAVVVARERLAIRMQHAVVDGLRRRCFQALLRAEWRWVSAGRQGDHANLLITDVNRVGSGLHFALLLAATLATLLVYVGVAFAMSWTVTALALASGGLVLVALMGQRRQALALGQGLGEANRALHAAVQDCLNGFKLTKILGNEDRHLARFVSTAAGLRQQQLGFVVRSGRANAFFQVGGAALLAAYLYLGLEVWPTPLPQLLALVVVFSRLIPLLGAAHQLHHNAVHALPAVHETEQLLADGQRAAEPTLSAAVLPWPVHDTISLREVVVKFDGRERPALDRLSLRLPARGTTAILGPSGAGKSTLADVLIGLLSPDEGSVLVDGVPITGEQRMRWRHSVAYVPQDAFLLHDTIRGNLQWAVPQAGDAELREALQRAAADFVWQLPLGLDTVVGDGGVRLSGGERQRLALARALLKRPGLLILDEATSALDTDNERRVMQSIESLHGNMTVVVIGHRLPRLDQVDQVVLMRAGRAVAQGSWQQVQQWQEAHA